MSAVAPSYVVAPEAKHHGVLAFKPRAVVLKQLAAATAAKPKDYVQEVIEVVQLLAKEPAHKRTFEKVVDFCADIVRVLPEGDRERVLTELCDLIDRSSVVATAEEASRSQYEERVSAARRRNAYINAIDRGDITWAALAEAEEARIRAMKTPAELAAEAAAKAVRAATDATEAAQAEIKRREQLIKSNKNNSLRLGNLPRGIKEETLREHFGPYGRIMSLRIPLKRETGETRGFAFIEYSSPADAAKTFYAFTDNPLTLHESYKSPDGYESEKDRLVTVEFTSS